MRADGDRGGGGLEWNREPNGTTARAFATPDPKESIMLRYAVIFFVIALIAAVLGFGGIAAGAADIAKLLFVVFLVLAVLNFVVNLVKGK